MRGERGGGGLRGEMEREERRKSGDWGDRKGEWKDKEERRRDRDGRRWPV